MNLVIYVCCLPYENTHFSKLSRIVDIFTVDDIRSRRAANREHVFFLIAIVSLNHICKNNLEPGFGPVGAESYLEW